MWVHGQYYEGESRESIARMLETTGRAWVAVEDDTPVAFSMAKCSEIWLLTSADPAVRANGFYRHIGWEAAGVQEDGQMKYIRRRGGA